MAMTQTGAPEALHLGADDLPFVEIGDGNKLKVIQVNEKEGLWIVENIFQAGFEVQTHRHTGPVWGYTSSGAWKYKEYDYVNRAGSFLYEPAGSVHTLQCIEDDTQVWFHMYGVNLNLDADGNVEIGRRRRGRAGGVLRAVRGAGLRPPERHRGVTVSAKRRIGARSRELREDGEEVRPWWTRPETAGVADDGDGQHGTRATSSASTEAAIDTADPVSLGRGYVGAMRRAARRPLHSVPGRHPLRGRAGPDRHAARHPCCRPPLPEVDPSRSGATPASATPPGQDNIVFHGGLEVYLLTSRLIHELVAAAGLEGREGPKAEFAATPAQRRCSRRPTSCSTNPRALKRAFETGGTSVLRGAAQLRCTTWLQNDGWPSQVDRSSFELGRNIAATPGQVVFRNELIEVLQYEPTTDEVFEVPLLVIPPWINRYYIADLAPGKSLVEWAVQPRSHHVRGELPQSRRVDARPHLRRLPPARAAHRHRRRARDHRQRDGEHAGDLPRRHDDRDVRSRTSTRAATSS